MFSLSAPAQCLCLTDGCITARVLILSVSRDLFKKTLILKARLANLSPYMELSVSIQNTAAQILQEVWNDGNLQDHSYMLHPNTQKSQTLGPRFSVGPACG